MGRGGGEGRGGREEREGRGGEGREGREGGEGGREGGREHVHVYILQVVMPSHLVQFICLIISKIIPSKVISQYSKLVGWVRRERVGGVRRERVGGVREGSGRGVVLTRMSMTKPSSRHTSTTELMMDSQWIWGRGRGRGSECVRV